MDLNDKLILLKKQNKNFYEDITNQIKHLEIKYDKYCVTFSNNSEYKIKLENILILNKKNTIDTTNCKVLYKGTIKSNIVKIDIYSDEKNNVRYMAYNSNGKSFICSQTELQYYRVDDKIKGLLEYWKCCACEINLDKVKQMMSQQYANLNIDSSSVLSYYLNKTNQKNQSTDSIICPFDFNNTQLTAIRSALENKISIIKGPPGTGKTQTILNLICNLIVLNKNVAIISANNSTINNIEQKLAKIGLNSVLASLGNGERKENFFNQQQEKFEISSKDNISIPIEKLKTITKMFENNITSKNLTKTLSEIKLERQYYEKFNHENIIDVSKYKFKTSESLLKYLVMYQEDTEDKKFNLFLWLKLILKYGFKKSLLKAKERDKIITSLEYEFYNLKTKELEAELEKLLKILEKKDTNNIIKEYKELSINFLNNYISKNINFNTIFTQTNYKKEFANFIKRYPIITSTTISFMSSIQSQYMFDYIIIDESSQVTIPSIIPLLNKCKNIVIVGDDKQLPPIEKFHTICNFDDVYNCTKNSLITSFMQIYPKKITMLLEHYRCDPQIIGFCNLKYYDDKLIPCTTSNEGNNALSIFYTPDGNHMRKIRNGEKNGTYNQREIDTIEEILNNNFSDINHSTIGIISPYKLQIEKLKQKYEDIECDTIHKFQGREKDNIIFSAVLDQKGNKHDFEFVDNPNMINVTVSRAIEKFILVTDNQIFKNKGKEVHDLINYISYKTMNENIFQSKRISVFDNLYNAKKDVRIKSLKNYHGESKYDSEKLIQILLDKIIKEEQYKQFCTQEQVKLKDIFRNNDTFNEEELAYIKHNSSVDFLVKDIVNQDLICAIEVDGIQFHENNAKQLKKDAIKDSIFKKSDLCLLRLQTNGSNEEEKIRNIFNDYLNKFKF